MESNFVQIRRTIEFHRSVSEEGIKSGDHFRLDRSYTSQYFDSRDLWKDKIVNFFKKLHEINESVVSIDVCGRTNARTLGADRTYCFSLKASDFAIKLAGPDKIYFNGDLFNHFDFDFFIKILKKNDIEPALVTFEPVAGLEGYGPEKKLEGIPNYKDITHFILAKRLSQVVKVLKPGGYIYLERPFQFDSDFFCDALFGKKPGEYILSIKIKKLCRKLKCRVEIRKTINGIYYLIRKPL